MKRFSGGTTVQGGYYWHIDRWEIVPVHGEVGALPGGAQDAFIRVPLPMLLLVAPTVGLAYAFFLPAAGFALAAYALGRKVGLVGSAAVEQAAATMAPSWRPGEVYFADQPGAPKAPEAEGAKSPELDALAAEVAERKGGPEAK